MNEYFLLITTDNHIKTCCSEHPDLYFYYHQLGCRSIEIVRPFTGKTTKNQIFVIDEEGALKPNRINVVASCFYGMPIYGNVLLAKEDFRNGEPDICGFNWDDFQFTKLAFRDCLETAGFTVTDCD